MCDPSGEFRLFTEFKLLTQAIKTRRQGRQGIMGGGDNKEAVKPDFFFSKLKFLHLHQHLIRSEKTSPALSSWTTSVLNPRRCRVCVFFRGTDAAEGGGGGRGGADRKGWRGATHRRDGTAHVGRPRQTGGHHRGVVRVQGTVFFLVIVSVMIKHGRFQQNVLIVLQIIHFIIDLVYIYRVECNPSVSTVSVLGILLQYSDIYGN